MFVRTCRFTLTALIIGIYALPRIAHGQTAVVDFTGQNITVGHSGNSSGTLGWAFSTNTPLSVTALGYYDDGQNGLSESHKVGIFDSSGTLLVSATVDSGSIDRIDGKFRYVDITPFTLNDGQNYTIGGTIGSTASDPVTYSVSGRINIPEITILAPASRYSDGAPYDSLTFPTLTFQPNYDYFGPNFEIGSVATPEPGTYAMIASLGLTGAAFLRRRRAR